jgi:hypothetical protein
MKRIALLTVLLLVVGLAAFAVDVKPTVAITGVASVTWGYNLDTGNTGFLNTADSSFRVSFLAEDGTDTHLGTGAMYGSITVSNVELFWNADSAAGAWTGGLLDADLAAKIVITPFEIGVYAAPSLKQDFFGALEDADIPDLVVDKTETTFGMVGSGFKTDYGTWVTATFGPAAVTLKVVSDGDWNKAGTVTGTDTYAQYIADGTEVTVNAGDYVDAATGTDIPATTTLIAHKLYLKKTAGAAATIQGNNYAFGGEVVLTFAPLTVSAGGYYGSTVPSFYGKVALDMAPIVVWGALEANMPTSGLEYGAGGGLTFTITEGTTLAATAWYGDAYQGLDLNVVFTEPGDKGLIPGLDTAITFNLLDLGGAKASEWEVVTATGFKIGLNSDMTNYARPYVNFTYGMANDSLVLTSTGTTVMNAEAGVQLQVIPLTLLTAKWVSGNKLNADLASSPMALGSLQFVATVTY